MSVLGVGPVFCQGVDLLYLVNDRPEKRKEAAEELAAGKALTWEVVSSPPCRQVADTSV